MLRWHEEYENQLKQQLAAKMRLTPEEEQLMDRLSGCQPSIEICGHTYFVNWMQERLERKGAPLEGLKFAELEDFYANDMSKCTIPYDTKKGGILDYNNLIELPENVAFVEFPTPQRLDPVGYCRSGRGNLKDVLSELPQIQQHKAKLVTPKNAWLRYVVATNRRDKGLPPLKESKGIRRSRR